MISDRKRGSNIHSTAIIAPSAKLGEGVCVGPFSIVGTNVILEDGVRVHSHVVIDGCTRIGAGTEIFPFASIGSPPQDLKYSGEASELVVGENNVIREYVTMNPGTEGGGMITRVGNHCLFMIGAHIAHDCDVGDNAVLANNATLAGHVSDGSFAILGGLSAVHQFVRIGQYAIVGGMTGVEHDVIPFGSVKGDRARLSGLNIIGMKRRGFNREEVDQLRKAYRQLFFGIGTFQERLERLTVSGPKSKFIQIIIDFINAGSNRSICQPREEEPH